MGGVVPSTLPDDGRPHTPWIDEVAQEDVHSEGLSVGEFVHDDPSQIGNPLNPLLMDKAAHWDMVQEGDLLHAIQRHQSVHEDKCNFVPSCPSQMDSSTGLDDNQAESSCHHMVSQTPNPDNGVLSAGPMDFSAFSGCVATQRAWLDKRHDLYELADRSFQCARCGRHTVRQKRKRFMSTDCDAKLLQLNFLEGNVS